MSLKIKASKPKLRRRGDRLIETLPDGTRDVYLANGDGTLHLDHRVLPSGAWSRTIKRTPDGDMCMVRAHHPDDKYDMIGVVVRDQVDPIAQRFADPGSDKGGSPWLFREDDSTDYFVSVSETGLKNAALLAGLCSDERGHVAELSQEIADFCGVSTLLVPLKKVIEACQDSKFALVRHFDFQVIEEMLPVGSGHVSQRVQNHLRHTGSNYEQMLRAGGLMHPNVYDTVKRGANLLVRSAAIYRSGDQ
jgi:hypothetical protein